MWRELLWKEWRGARAARLQCALAGFASIALLYLGLTLLGWAFRGHLSFPPRPFLLQWLRSLPALVGLVTAWTALLLAADSIAGERERNTLPFLLARPLSRTHIWAAKALTGVTAVTAVAVTQALILFLLDHAMAWHPLTTPGVAVELKPYLPTHANRNPEVAIVPSWLVLAGQFTLLNNIGLCAGLLASARARGTSTAVIHAAAGLVPLGYAWWVTAPHAHVNAMLPSLWALLTALPLAIIALLLSLRLFTSESLPPRSSHVA